MPSDHAASLSIAYFEHIAKEPGKKALCFPLHVGTLEVLLAFMSKHWRRGFVLAAKTSEQLNILEEALHGYLFSQNAHHGHTHKCIISLRSSNERDLLQEYLEQEIVLTTYDVILQYPQQLFNKIGDSSDKKTIRQREFTIFIECPALQTVALTEAEYHLLRSLTDGIDNISSAIERIKEKKSIGNGYICDSVNYLLTHIEKYQKSDRENLSILDEVRNFHLIRLMLEALQRNTFHKYNERYDFYYHLESIHSPHLWIIDGTADVLLRESKLWEVQKEPVYTYQLISPSAPLPANIPMIPRNLQKISDDTTATYERIQEWIESLDTFLGSLVHKHEMILLVIWKDLQKSITKSRGGVLPIETGDFIGGISNQLVKGIESSLDKMYPKKFQVISYNRRGDYSFDTNISQKLDAVVFIGKFFIPSYVIGSWNKINNSLMTSQDYSLSELVKHIFSTRSQFGEPVFLYYSDDWGKDFIQSLLDYTQAKDITGNALSVFSREEQLRKILYAKGLRQTRQQDYILNIIEQYPNFPQTWTITFDREKLFGFLTKAGNKPHMGDIRKMLKTFEKCGIHISIESK